MNRFPWMRRLLEAAEEGEPGGGDGPAGEGNEDQGAKPEGGEKQPDAKDLQRKPEAAESRLAEAERATEFWHSRATSRGEEEKPTKPAKADEDADDDVEAFINDVNKRGAKAIDDYIKRRGYVDEKTVEGKIESRINAALAEAELMGKYGDLKDKESEMFKETARQYKQLEGIPGELRTKLAVERAELELRRTGKFKDSSEEARLARIAAQSGGSGAGRHAEQDGPLSAEQKTIAANFGISEDKYKKRAAAGVNIQGALGQQLSE